MNIYQVIKKPIITEKSFSLAEKGKYSFWIERKANKHQIIQAFKKMYSVDAVKINIINTPFKEKITKTRKGNFITRIQPFKKAIIQLKKDQKISDFETKK